MFGQADPALLTLTWQGYNVVLVCAPDFPFVQDGARCDDAFRHRPHAWYLEQLAERGIAYTLLIGGHEERLQMALQALDVAAPLDRRPGTASADLVVTFRDAGRRVIIDNALITSARDGLYAMRHGQPQAE